MRVSRIWRRLRRPTRMVRRPRRRGPLPRLARLHFGRHTMGAWSIHAFANDDAAEFIAELEKADSDEPLSRAIATVNGSMGYLDASDAARAIAAAELVAAGLGRPCSALEGEEAAAA